MKDLSDINKQLLAEVIKADRRYLPDTDLDEEEMDNTEARLGRAILKALGGASAAEPAQQRKEREQPFPQGSRFSAEVSAAVQHCSMYAASKARSEANTVRSELREAIAGLKERVMKQHELIVTLDLEIQRLRKELKK
jgi:hypothetical protein